MSDQRTRPTHDQSNQAPDEPPSLRLIALVVVAYAAVVLINGLLFILLADLLGWFEPEAVSPAWEEVAGVLPLRPRTRYAD